MFHGRPGYEREQDRGDEQALTSGEVKHRTAMISRRAVHASIAAGRVRGCYHRSATASRWREIASVRGGGSSMRSTSAVRLVNSSLSVLSWVASTQSR